MSPRSSELRTLRGCLAQPQECSSSPWSAVSHPLRGSPPAPRPPADRDPDEHEKRGSVSLITGDTGRCWEEWPRPRQGARGDMQPREPVRGCGQQAGRHRGSAAVTRCAHLWQTPCRKASLCACVHSNAVHKRAEDRVHLGDKAKPTRPIPTVESGLALKEGNPDRLQDRRTQRMSC